MANTTFNGAVRSENGFTKVTKSDTLGTFTADSTYSTNASVGGTTTLGGALTRLTPENIIDWDYISCPTPIVGTLTGAGGADGVMADGELFSMLFPGKNGQVTQVQGSIIGPHTVAASGFMVEGTLPVTDTNGTVAGLNLQGDAATADNTGLELIFGGTQHGGGASCTIGTHAMVFDATFNSVDFTDQDCVAIGFRKVEEFQTGHQPIIAAASGDAVYTDYVAFGVLSPDDVQISTRLNDGTTAHVDSTQATAASGNHRFQVTVSSAGVVTFAHIGAAAMSAGTLAAPSTTKTFTFDDGDVVVPYLSILSTNQDSAIHLKAIKITRTPGISYTD
tara:strand:- start:2784 stop:3785 length:1002 start_codon:yes stop_codon:yes gene_type:complete